MPTFDVFGRRTLAVERRGDRWVVLRVGEGTRVPVPELALDPELEEDELAEALADLLHEEARPGAQVRRIDGTPG